MADMYEINEERGRNILTEDDLPTIDHIPGGVVDLRGKEYGHLHVMKHSGFLVTRKGRQQSLWQCICDCGRIVTARESTLLRGRNPVCTTAKKLRGYTCPSLVVE